MKCVGSPQRAAHTATLAALPPGISITSPNVSPPRSSSVLVRISTSHAKSPTTHRSISLLAHDRNGIARRRCPTVARRVHDGGDRHRSDRGVRGRASRRRRFPGAGLLAVPLVAIDRRGPSDRRRLAAAAARRRRVRRQLVPPPHAVGPAAAAGDLGRGRVRRSGSRSSSPSATTVRSDRRRDRRDHPGDGRDPAVADDPAPRRRSRPTTRDAVVYGSAGGFTTFVSNSAGPVMNTYLVGLGLDKDAAGRHVGVVLLRRQPRQDPALHRARLPHDRRRTSSPARACCGTLCMVPAIVAGVYAGRCAAAPHLAGDVRHPRARAVGLGWLRLLL